MKATSIAGLFILFLLAPAYGQSATKNHDLASPAAVVRIKALQNQVERQQIEIEALRLHLGKLQQDFQDLADMIANRNAESDDDDSADDDVTFLRVHSRSQKPIRHKTKTARRAIAVDRRDAF
ncbi:MAG TPA: hypothetical protein VNX88_19615 [Terriglobales bacterium]|nr:hypothetical protein [Terriglobales bacterium]